jgi:ATP-dependent DNA helicase RecG
MIIENADRFGLSQLHQLRGRIGRGVKDSLCVLIARAGGTGTCQNPRRESGAKPRPCEPGGPPLQWSGARMEPPASSAMRNDRPGKAAERLAIMAQTTDGFEIAEADLAQRGPGELFGTRQHGLPELRFGDLVADFGWLEKARTDAFEIVQRDPQLRHADHQLLLPPLKRMFGEKLALIDAA